MDKSSSDKLIVFYFGVLPLFLPIATGTSPTGEEVESKASRLDGMGKGVN
jgi:hypothetical protein